MTAFHRAGLWLGHQVAVGMAWFDGLPGWLQLTLVIAVLLVVCAAMHVDDLRREREWRAFRRWLERQKPGLRGMKL